MRKTLISIFSTALFFCILITTILSEVVILRDGNKYIGNLTDNGDTYQINTPDGVMTVKKDRVKSIYQDAATVIKQNNEILAEAQKLIAGANKIPDPKERNATLDKSIEMLMKCQGVCFDVLEIFSGRDGEAIAGQFKDINGTLKHARFLKVLDTDLNVPPTVEPLPTTKPQAKTINPKDIEAAKESYELGILLLEGKQYEKARDILLRAISANPDFAEAYVRIGEAYAMLKDDELAYTNYCKFLEIAGKVSVPSKELVKLQEDALRKTEKFRLLSNKISALTDNLIFDLICLGDICLDDNDYILGDDVLSLVLKIENNNSEAQKGLKRIKEELKKEVKTDVPEDANLSDVYYQAGVLQAEKGKYDEAIEKFNKALSYHRAYPNALFKLGECYEKLNDSRKALKNYRLWLKYFETLSSPSKEENDIMASISRALDRIDNNGKQFNKSKGDFISGSWLMVNECLNKRCNWLASSTAKQILNVDPAHKNAQQALDKLNKNTPPVISNNNTNSENPAPDTKPAPKPTPPSAKVKAQDLIKGKWELKGGYPLYQKWRVSNGRIECDLRLADAVSIFMWSGTLPEKYTLTVKFIIDKVRSSSTDHVGVVYQGEETYISFTGSDCKGAGAINTIILTNDGGNLKVTLNGKVARENIAVSSPSVGLMARNSAIAFTTVSLLEME